MNSQSAWERAMGMCGYSGSPAEKEDRQAGIKVGGVCYWNVLDIEKPDSLPAAIITSIRIDTDGDPWYSLKFLGDDHKDVEVERNDIKACK